MKQPTSHSVPSRFLRSFLTCTLLVGVALAQPRQELVQTIDQRAQELLGRHDVAGAAVALVLDGELAHAAGYGLADADTGREATADTPFALASVTKLFTWTLLMQLVEAGEVDLDDPVEPYVDLDVPDDLRIRHLLTHTTGLDDMPLVGLLPSDPSDLAPLREALLATRPRSVRDPGSLISYDNWGTALAALVVERVTFASFENAVQERILDPLGMTRTTARQPPPSSLEAARPHVPGRDGPRVAPPELSRLGPAGGMNGSATDLARFALAYLHEGAYEGGRILEPATVERMREVLHENPGGSGNAYGWWAHEAYGLRVLEHSGDTVSAHAVLLTVPEREAALVVLTNSPAGGLVRAELVDTFLRELAGPTRGEPVVATEVDPASYAGLWVTSRTSRHTTGKLLSTLSGLFPITSEGDGLRLLDVTGNARTFVPVSETLFVEPDTGKHLAFALEDGRPTRAYVSDLPMFTLLAQPWWRTPIPLAIVLGTAFLASLAALVVWPWSNRRARRRGVHVPSGRTLRVVTRLAAGSIVALGLALAATAATAVLLVQGMTPAFALTLALAALVLVMAAGSVVVTVQAYGQGSGSRGDRTWATLVTTSAVATSALIVQWNLLPLP